MAESGTESKSADYSPVISALNWYLPVFTILFLGEVCPANVYSTE